MCTEMYTYIYIMFYQPIFYQNLCRPLHHATKNGHIEIVEILGKAGADINAYNKV